MFDDQTVKLQLLAALLDRFIQFDPGEKTPEDGPVSPGVEPPEEGGVDINDPAEPDDLRAGLQPGMSQGGPGRDPPLRLEDHQLPDQVLPARAHILEVRQGQSTAAQTSSSGISFYH